MLMDTKNEGGYIPLATHGSKKADGLGISTSKMEVWYLGECRKVDHEGRWLGIFQLDKEESTHLEKMIKGEAAKKMGLKSNI